MKPHPRIRKSVKWGGAAITVLLLVVWVGSGWWQFMWASGGGARASISGGGLELVWYQDLFTELGPGRPSTGNLPPPKGCYWAFGSRTRYTLQWPLDWGELFYAKHLVVPLWATVAMGIAVTFFAWRLDTLARRRAKLGVCPKCSYSRTGLAVGAVCPECGSPAPVAAPSA